jgi:prolyl-tRNA synthetase
LIGIPNRVVISPKSLEAGGVEFKKRNESEGKIISVEELFQFLK